MQRFPLPENASPEAGALHKRLEAALDVLASKANAPADEKAASEKAVRVAARAFFEQQLTDSSTAYRTTLAAARQSLRDALTDLGFVDPPTEWIESHPSISQATLILNTTQSAVSAMAAAFN